MRPVPWLSGCLAAVLVLASVEQVRSQVLPNSVDEAESVEAGLISIESDSQSADNVTGVVTASGNVRIEYPTRGVIATSRQAQYFSREGRIVLSGDVDLIQEDGSRLRAERVTYNLDDERALALPAEGNQVRSTLLIPAKPTETTPLTP